MNEMDLMKAMTDMDDNLLEMPPRRKIKGTAFIVLAALIALLVTSVSAAVNYGVNLSYVSNELDLKPQKITDTLYQQLSEEITRQWKANMEFAEKYNVPLTTDENRKCNSRVYFQDRHPYQLQGPCYCNICYLEEALGFQLVLTPQMKEAQRRSGSIPGQYKGDEKISFYVYYGTSAENCAAIEKNELLQPEGFSLWFLMGGYPQEEDHVLCEILLPLTEENAELQKNDEMAYLGKMGELKSEELQYGDIHVLLFYATPEPGHTGKAYAYYCVDGIGYCITAYDIKGDGDAKQMLLDLLDGLAEIIEG